MVVGDKLNPVEFPGTILLDLNKLMGPGYYAEAVRTSSYSLSEDLLSQLVQDENLFLANSDRLAFFRITVRLRRTIYYNMVLYWYTVLKNHPVDAVVFATTPHLGWDNVLYAVARNFGIRTVIFERSNLDNYIFTVDDYFSIEKIPEDYLSGKSVEEIRAMINPEFQKLLNQESYFIKHARKIVQRKKASLFWATVAGFFHPEGYRKKTGYSTFALNGPISKNELFIIEQIRKLRSAYLRRFYTKLARKMDLKQDYVFFGLQFQPERTSIPLGGIFEDQVLTLQILSKAIPPGWKIFVKEHPRQLKRPNMTTWHYRDRDFYKRLIAIPKVVLIDVEQDTKELIRHAKVVATVTGTVGWESLLERKNSLIFGYPWYGACRNCYHVNSIESCRKAIQVIAAKTAQETESDFLKFISYYGRFKFINAVMNIHELRLSGGDPEKFIDNLTNALVSKLREGSLAVKNKAAFIG